MEQFSYVRLPVIVPPAADSRVDRLDHLAKPDRSISAGQAADLILEPIHRFLPRNGIKTHRIGSSCALVCGQLEPFAPFDLVAEKLKRPFPHTSFRSCRCSKRRGREPIGPRRATPLLPFQHRAGQFRFREPVRRSTLADANETRDWRIYAEFAHRLIAQARKLYAEESLGIELSNTVYALDSTTIDLCLSLFPWAHFRSTKAAVKMHTLLDLRGNIPSFIHISDGKAHDVSCS